MSVNLESAARRWLLADPTVAGYVGSKCWAWTMEEKEHPSGKGTRAIRLRTDGSHRDADSRRTALYPVLVVECWADYSRDENGDKIKEDRIPNARALWGAVHRRLHGRRGDIWGAVGSNPGLSIASSALWTYPIDVYADDAMAVSGVRLPGVELGDCAVVLAEYAIEVVG